MKARDEKISIISPRSSALCDRLPSLPCWARLSDSEGPGETDQRTGQDTPLLLSSGALTALETNLRIDISNISQISHLTLLSVRSEVGQG